MVFRSAAMRHVSERAAAVAESEITVLIQGETGTGKEVVARFIHNRSERHGGPFVVVNCGGLNPNLVDSELFGHEAGAFTGATGLRRGRIETARGGTILIDEVDDLPPEIQLKLLRFLQERSFERVGGNDPIPADARVLCATKQPLLELVDAGMFRDDLFYRINSVVVLIPPLRDRRDDVLPLATRFIAELTAGRREPPCLAPAARDALLEHRWPGNVRELRHAIEHAVTFARGQTIELQHLPAALSQSGEPPNIAVQVALAHLESASFVDVVAECERQLIEWALGRSAGNQGRAAELLGLSRTTFRGRLDAMRSRAAEPGVDDSARES
jgi:DNA-binding NtrC family response regulator